MPPEFVTAALAAGLRCREGTGADRALLSCLESVSIAWDAGIELCAPLPGREDSSAISRFLASHGEGVMNVFFNVCDGEAAIERAKRQGYNSVQSLDYTQTEIDQHLGGLFQRYQEFTLDTGQSCGFTISLARIEAKQDAHAA